VAVACSICVGAIALGVSPARAMRPNGRSTARVAHALAKIIRRDARQEGRRSKNTVTVTKRCCGVRVLRVHYQAKVRRRVSAAYILRLETKRGTIRGVAVSESSTEVGYEAGAKIGENTRQYEIAIQHAPHGPNGGWSFRVFYADISWTAHGPAGQRMGEGSAFECQHPGLVPTPVYEQALTVAREARRHVPAAPQAVLRSACR
jgi:hypothetical protein